MNKTGRRQFLQSSVAPGGGLTPAPLSHSSAATAFKTTQVEPDGFFTLGRQNDHWWLITPDGKPFFTVGLNHMDPATLRYPENIHIWREKYGGDTIRWIKESVVANLKTWGFNTVGWVQEVSSPGWRHSRSFTADEYKALNMPYGHMLPFTESHHWEKHTVHFDYRSAEWQEWCDYVARSQCTELSDDPNLIGYFYSDCQTWIHQGPNNEWRGPIFDPDLLETESGRRELTDLAHSYYKTTHDAIRRYDKHHLILGDRYDVLQPIAMQVINAAMPYVDVLSLQDFRDPVKHLQEWHEKTGKPVLLADSARLKRSTSPGDKFLINQGQGYAETLEGLFQNPGCIGFHLCGAYQRNRARRWGLLDEMEKPDAENVPLMQAANLKISQWMERQF